MRWCRTCIATFAQLPRIDLLQTEILGTFVQNVYNFGSSNKVFLQIGAWPIVLCVLCVQWNPFYKGRFQRYSSG
jgi:hypothetical protein